MKHYEELTTTPVEMTTEENILAASGEKTNCKIDPVNVTVEDFIDAPENHISKSFSLDIE